MQKLFLILLALTTLQSCCFNGDCQDDIAEEPIITSNYEPVILDRVTFENSVTLEEPKTIINSGKIYVIGNLLFVNEVNQGFHVLDNQDPTNPIQIAFINAPGSTDVAIKNNVFFINQAVDLIAVIYDKEAASLLVTKRVTNVFPTKQSPDGFIFNAPGDSVIVNFELIN